MRKTRISQFLLLLIASSTLPRKCASIPDPIDHNTLVRVGKFVKASSIDTSSEIASVWVAMTKFV